ncbi:MAG: hypothetical protein AB7G21_07650 [Dehalococcoidia bacterium]
MRRLSPLGLVAAALLGVAALVSAMLLVRAGGESGEAALITIVLAAQTWFAAKAAAQRSVRAFLGVALLAFISAFGPVEDAVWPLVGLASVFALGAAGWHYQRQSEGAEPAPGATDAERAADAERAKGPE